MLNATYRLLVTAQQKVTAEGEWWNHLPEEMKKQYIEEHPHSKYAQGYQPKQEENKPAVQKHEENNPAVQKHEGEQPPVKPNQPKPPVNAPQKPATPTHPTGQGKGQGLVKRPAAPKPFKPKDRETEEAFDRLPKKSQAFLKSGGTAAGSKQRKEAGQAVKQEKRGLARGILKDTVGIAKGLNSMRRMVNGKPEEGDLKKAASFIGTILGTSAMVGLLGVSGPVGFLAFMAVKHAAAPDLYNIVRSAFQKKPPGNKPGYGYWKDDNTWVPLSKKEFDSLTDDEVNHYQDTGKDKAGKFKQFENRHGASVVTATEDEEMMTKLLDAIADYAEQGNISDDAWAAAVRDAGGTGEQD